MRIEIICTGDEVLTGKIVNTNFSYISQKLEDVGLSVQWETTVGDDRQTLLRAFQLAAERADAVIVNGGLGPTVDDLSQEIAAQAAGVDLVLSEEWLTRMEDFFRRRSRVMPSNNRKQAMLPASAEMIDNPIGTACGFALDIGKARFFFTPGVPRELRRMLEEQVIPRLLARSGLQTVIHLKRFHSYGLGESHVDALLAGVEELVPDGSVKLGFRAHYPQLETKLTARGSDMDDIRSKLMPVEREVRKRLGNFILAEDDQTLEGVVLGELTKCHASLSIVETFTSGQIAARIAHLPGAEAVVRRGTIARDLAEVYAAVGLGAASAPADLTRETAEAVASAARRHTGATHALAVLIDLDDGPDRIEFGGTICLAIATEQEAASRRSRIVGGREWVRLGAVEMGLDCLRRYLQGLPVYERIDFEKSAVRRKIMARLTAITNKSQVAAKDHGIVDAIVKSRGALQGPFTMLLHCPELAGRVAHLGAFVRFEGSLDMRVRVLAAMVVAREFDAVYVWGAQTGSARKQGVPEATITAIREKHSRGLPPEDAQIVECTQQLIRKHRVDDATAKALQQRFGNDGFIQLTGAIGYYSMLSMTVNACELEAGTGAEILRA